MTDTPTPTLYDWLGGLAALQRLTERFYERVKGDTLLAPVFAHMSSEHPAHVAAFLAEVLGGTPVQSMMGLARTYGSFFKLTIMDRDVYVASSQELVDELCDETRFGKRVQGAVLQLRAVAGDIAQLVRFGLPDDYWNEYADLVSAVSVEETNTTARTELKPDQLIWIVVGDLGEIESEVRALGLGELDLMDADGRLLTSR